MSHFLVVFIGAPLGVYERYETYGEPLEELLGASGNITGEGSSSYEQGDGWVQYGCYLDVEVNDLQSGIASIKECLIKAGAPKSSTVTQFKPKKLVHPIYGEKYEPLEITGRTCEMGSTTNTTEDRLVQMEPSPITHPFLGQLRNIREGYWQGYHLFNGEYLDFVIVGGTDEPDTFLSLQTQQVLANWSGYLDRLNEFLKLEVEKLHNVRAEDFTPSLIAFLWKDELNIFMLELTYKDENRLWKVRFESGQPTFLRARSGVTT